MKLARTVPPRGLMASTGFPVEVIFYMEHLRRKVKYVCTRCSVRDLEMGFNVEFDSKKNVPVHRFCGGRVAIDEKASEADWRHSR
jgi:hypothetical protein